jgi:hypothetical protein
MGLKERGVFALVLFSAAVLFAAPALSQTFEKGKISGTAFDPSGAVVPNASVKIIHVATGAERTLTTGPDGRYVAGILPVGEYRIEVSASGFATTIVRGVRLAVGQSLNQDVSLKLAAAGQTVEVTAEASLIDKTDPLENSVFGQRYIDQLPVNGRDFRDFVRLAPASQESPGLRSPVRLGGQWGEFTGFIIDGVDNRNSFFGEWFGSLETRNFTIPEDSIQEFQVRTNGFSAEFGHSTGGLINVVTKSGTNDWHGTAHWFFQNLNLIKTTSTPASPATPIPPSITTRHQFGGTVGGPISKDKAFFFFAIDRERTSGPLITKFNRDVTAAPCPCPIPALYGGGDLSKLQGSFSQGQKLLTPLIRFDWKASARNTSSTRANYTRNRTQNFTGGRGQILTSTAQSGLEDFVNEGYAVTESFTTAFSARTVNEARFAVSREMRPRRNKGPGPETSISDTGGFGRTFFLPIDSDHKRFQAIDNFSRTFGKHDVKLGVDLNANGNSQVFIGFAGGDYSFSALEDFKNCVTIPTDPTQPCSKASFQQLVGINGFDAVQSGTVPTFWQKELAFYAQDNWRLTSRLTINLGLRWDGVWNPQPQFTPFPDSNPHKVALGEASRVGNAVQVGTGPVPQNIPNDFNDWGPRVGFAYDLRGNAKTIVRGGAGIYYAAMPSIFMANMLSGTGLRGGVVNSGFGQAATGCPTNLTLTPPRVCYPDVLPLKATPALQASLGPPSIRYADPNLQSARVVNVQVGVEHELVKDLSISGTYSYNRTENLRIGGFHNGAYDRNFNPPTTAASFDQFGRTVNILSASPQFPSAPVLGRLDPTLAQADDLSTFGRARYHSFILQVKKNFSHRHQFGINYVWSKNDDNAANDRDTDFFWAPSDPFNLNIDYGRSQLDITHQFTAYAVIQLPFDIWFSTSVRARSGLPLAAYISECFGPGANDYNRDGNCTEGFLHQVDRPIANGQLVPRYPARQPKFGLWDVRIGRDFALGTERLKLRFSADIFNVTNARNAFTRGGFDASDNVVFGSSTYGILDRVSGSTSAQFGLKVLF